MLKKKFKKKICLKGMYKIGQTVDLIQNYT